MDNIKEILGSIDLSLFDRELILVIIEAILYKERRSELYNNEIVPRIFIVMKETIEPKPIGGLVIQEKIILIMKEVFKQRELCGEEAVKVFGLLSAAFMLAVASNKEKRRQFGAFLYSRIVDYF